MKRSLHLLLSTALALSTLRCTEAEDDSSTDAIKILAPKAGATFKLTDDVLIIAESDYSKFASGIRVNYSIDDGKNWSFMIDKVRKENVAKDTLLWNFSTELPGVLTAGSKVRFQVSEYNKKYFKNSPVITFTD